MRSRSMAGGWPFVPEHRSKARRCRSNTVGFTSMRTSRALTGTDGSHLVQSAGCEESDTTTAEFELCENQRRYFPL